MVIKGKELHVKLVAAFQVLLFLLLALIPANVEAQRRGSRQKVQAVKSQKNSRGSEKKGKIGSERAVSKQERRKALLEARRQRLEEIRRRQEAIRRERERRLAFERGLRQETAENILNDNLEGENLEIRRAAINALGSHAGTVVVMETDTGKILTIVNQNWAIRRGFKPCSTIKLVTAIAGINEGIINENGEIISRPFSLRLADALAYSNNVYFQRVGNEIGSEKFIAYAKMLGLGETTGINAEGESPGKLPYGNESLKIYSHGDDIEVTPLQLAVMVSAITNGGKIVVPQIAKNDVQKAGFTAVRREMNLPRKTLQGLLPGMLGAVAYGTAKTSDGVFYSVAGKTGSCIGQGSWLGLFASVAPAINPKYTVVVVTRGQAERGRNAAIIAGKIYQALFSKSKDAQTLLAESKRQISIPKPQVDAKLSMLLDGENEEANEILTEGVKRSRKISITKQRSIDDLLDEEGLGGDSPNLKTTVDSKNPTDSKTQKKNVVKPIIIEVKKPNLSKEGETEKTENEKKDESKKDSFTRPRIVKSSSRVME
ncbi:MAG: hypothetical protein D6687_01860 [Acidobacteria bacterium]|jgi:membrane peptidoglycan carboxypeptidase|nr:MAG: hypothetical protein D6687_01860 [Acidobacteriota bacterium]GIU81886.1 MAG: hypothetical protein KatS3mg006_0950 [Pyrinomonadaceae bacterium]